MRPQQTAAGCSAVASTRRIPVTGRLRSRVLALPCRGEHPCPCPSPFPAGTDHSSAPSTNGKAHHPQKYAAQASARPQLVAAHAEDSIFNRAAAAARSALAAVLAATITLSGPLAPLGAAARPTLSPPSSTTAATIAPAAAAAPPAPSASAPGLTGPAPASAAAPVAILPGSSSPAAATSSVTASSIRFTGPEVLDVLPPLPTEFPPLPELKLPKYTTATLRNGLRMFLLRDDEVPLVRATLLMRGGQYASPPDKVGLASLTTYVQRAGGSTAHPAAALDARLEELAASIELGAGPQALSADMACLAEDVEEVLGLMAEVIRSPAFPADKLALYQAQLLNALEHQNDSPGAVGRRKITKLLYGPDSAYARTPSKAGVAAITPADLRAFAERWERPDGAVLGVVGAFEPRQLMAALEREFGGWAPAAGQPPAPPAVPRSPPPALPAAVEAAAAAVEGGGGSAQKAEGSGPARRPVVYLVDRPGLTQASVLVGEPGISLSDPDVFALDVLGGVFNSFGGQLFDTLRSREGLAYSVSGSWDSPPDHQGLFLAGGQTSSPGEFLRSLRSLLGRAAAEPPSEAELAAAQAETLNSFAFNFASTSSQLQRILVYDLLGLPQDYLFRYFRGIEAVQRSDVVRAAAAHLHPERQAVVVVADREVAGPSLEAAGFEVVPMRLEDA